MNNANCLMKVDKEYNAFLGIALKLEMGDCSEKERGLLEKRFDEISKENPDYSLVAGGGIPSDCIFNKLNSVEDK